MAKKYTIEMAREVFAEWGYELLETEYKNNSTPMRFKCPKHPDQKNTKRLQHLMNGYGCIHCGNERKAEKFKFSFDKVKNAFEEKGYILLEKEYKNNRQKLRYKCPEHPDKDLTIDYSSLQQGKGCIYCAGKNKYTYEEVKSKFEERGYELLDDEYVNTSTPLRYRCPRHPEKETKMTMNSLLIGRGCLHCAGQAAPTFEEVKSLFDKKGYILLSEKYVNSQTPLDYICPEHAHEVKQTNYRRILKGHGCQECYWDSRKGEGSHFWKGGVYTLSGTLRRKSKEWKMKILQENNFCCDISGENRNNLEVHHATPFNVIRDHVMARLGITYEDDLSKYDQETLDLIFHEFETEQSTTKGFPLRKDLHKEFHRLYGYSATLEDYYEFKEEKKKCFNQKRKT